MHKYNIFYRYKQYNSLPGSSCFFRDTHNVELIMSTGYTYIYISYRGVYTHANMYTIAIECISTYVVFVH